MSIDIILSVAHEGECMLISTNGLSSFPEFVHHVSGKWARLNSCKFEAKFSVGSVENCCLDSENDFLNLVSLCQITSQKLVSVQIKLLPCANMSDSNDRENHHFPIQDNFSNSDYHNSHNNDVQEESSNGGQNEIHDEFSNSSYSSRQSSGMPDSFLGDQYEVNIQGEINSDNWYTTPRSNKIPFKSVKKFKKTRDSGQPLEFEGDFSVPNYDVCPKINTKSLLSDSWSNIMEGGVGLEFVGGAVEFRTELIKYATQMGFKFRYVKNTRRYVTVACAESETVGCDWFIRAKLQTVTEYFEIAKCNLTHKCVGNLVNDSAKRLGSKIMGDLVLQDVRQNPSLCARSVMESLFSNYGIEIPYWKAWRTIEAARDQIFGSYQESYDQLRWYCSAIQRTNPGSVVSLVKNETTSCFESVFISFKACMDGFLSCRPMLFIDGTFMNGRAKGTLLSATAKDGKNGLYPVAFAVVSSETKKNWEWFLSMLRDNIKHEMPIFYISDRNVGLMSAFQTVFEQPSHFFCLYHLMTNLKGRFGKGWTNDQRANMCKYFKACAYAPTIPVFHKKVEIFKRVGGKIAVDWLEQLPYDKWAVAHSPHITRYGEMTSNAAESFNSWIKEARGLPVTYMIECIRSEIARWHMERRDKSRKWTGALCPTKEDSWFEMLQQSRPWNVKLNPDGQYLVKSVPSVLVNLTKKTCGCHQWQVKGFPCAHAAAVIKRKCNSVYTKVDKCYYTINYRKCYSFDIHAIPDTERFELVPGNQNDRILPPILKAKPGRPRSKRKPSYGEFKKRKKIFCSRCKQWGRHDALTCIQEPSAEDEESDSY